MDGGGVGDRRKRRAREPGSVLFRLVRERYLPDAAKRMHNVYHCEKAVHVPDAACRLAEQP